MEAEKYLVGRYNVTVDPQNRLIIPTIWQQSIGERVIVIRDLSESGEHYLTALPNEAFQSMMSDFSHVPATSTVIADETRDILQYACDCRFDSKRRISVNSDLIEYANIHGSAVLTSNVRSSKPIFEIWDPAALARNNEANNERKRREKLERNAEEVKRLSQKD